MYRYQANAAELQVNKREIRRVVNANQTRAFVVLAY